jgi:hypothetical protein
MTNNRANLGPAESSTMPWWQIWKIPQKIYDLIRLDKADVKRILVSLMRYESSLARKLEHQPQSDDYGALGVSARYQAARYRSNKVVTFAVNFILPDVLQSLDRITWEHLVSKYVEHYQSSIGTGFTRDMAESMLGQHLIEFTTVFADWISIVSKAVSYDQLITKTRDDLLTNFINFWFSGSISSEQTRVIYTRTEADAAILAVAAKKPEPVKREVKDVD